MHPILVISLLLAVSGLSQAAPTPDGLYARAQDDEFSLSARAWTRTQQKDLEAAQKAYGKEAALRGKAGFDERRYREAQSRYTALQTKKTAEERKRSRRRSLDFDDEDVLLSARAWTRTQEKDLEAAKKAYGKEAALRGKAGFDERRYREAQSRYTALQAKKTAEESKRSRRRSLDFDDEDVPLSARAWTRAQQKELEAAQKAYGKEAALRGKAGFDARRYREAQEKYQSLQAKKTAEEHKRGRKRSLDLDDEDGPLSARAWRRTQEKDLEAAKKAYGKEAALRGKAGFDEHRYREAQQKYTSLQAKKTAEERKRGRKRSLEFDDDDFALDARSWFEDSEGLDALD